MRSTPSARRARIDARDQRGQSTVELALLMPMLVFIALAIFQVALVARDQITVVHAAREAARAASVDPDQSRAVGAALRVLAGADVRIGARPKVGQPITVEVSYRSRTDLPVVGALFPDPVLHARVVIRVER